MPLRPVVLPSLPFASQHLLLGRRWTHGSANLRAAEAPAQSHYETLQVPVNASPKEIKTSFFALSKRHHPDHNPSDSEAPKRFMALSEAYTVLSSPASREKYDRDVLHLNAATANGIPRGSFHSTGQAGGRPATGLSRRRTTFQGPPPSFYRNGGWGAHGSKRRAAQEAGSSSTMGKGSTGVGGGDGSAAGAAPGMGAGQMPFGHANNVPPHFDRNAHLRTHERQQTRAQSKKTEDRQWDEAPKIGVFTFVCVMIIIFAVPGIHENRRRDKEVRARQAS